MITWDNVTVLAPALAALEEESQDLILDHVKRLLAPSKWGDLIDIGQAYLAAHLGTLVLRTSTTGSSSQSVGPVVSETVGSVSRTYAVLTAGSGLGTTSLSTTDWGREFINLRMQLPSRFGQVL